MEKVKALNVAIVGGGPGCKAIMDMIFAEKLSQLRMKLIGVACTNPKAVGYRYAQEKGIYTTQDYRDLYKLKNLNMIIELTGREEVANEIFRTKPEHVRLMGNVAARLFWDIFQIEEQRIAERKRAEEETRKRKEYLESIMDSSMDLILTVNKDGTLNFANKRIGNIFGYRSEDIKGRRFIEFIPEEMHSFVQEKWSEVQKGIGGSYETKVIKADGSIIDCLVSHSKLKGLDEYLAILKDIADHKRAEEALRESEARSRLILQTMPSGLFTVDLERKITSWNKEAEEIIGPKAEEVIGKDCLEVLECVECKKGCVLLDDKVDKPIYGKECVIHIDGEDIIISKNMDILRDSEGNTIGGLEIFINITERKRAEKEKKKLEAQLQHAQKMEAIGTLAGGIAHDFNNLLMGIQGNVSLMAMDIDSTHPHYKRLQSIEKQVQSGVKLTQQLLGYARKGRYEVKPIDLNQLVEETSETFSRTNKEITIHQELAKDLFAIEADLGQIEQVLLNLYVNAADAMHGGGNLILKTMNTAHKDMKGKLYDPKPGNYVLLTVTDTGTGMDKETIERIFDPFFTTKKMGRGTGLGLASAYGIIKGHGGYIDVESNKGRGTTFSIYLPASEKKIQKAIKTAEPFIRGTGTVLLVDDEEVILKVGQELLEAMGYRVLIARDGKEAVEVYKKNRDDIDIVVLDMVMPNMGGGEAYDRMKQINPDIKVLLSSGYSIDGQATEILERGCDGFIQKPFSMKELSEKIKEILEKKYHHSSLQSSR